MSSDLANWLLIQIDENERLANALGGSGWFHGWMSRHGPCVTSAEFPNAFMLDIMELSLVAVGQGEDAELTTRYIATWNPQRANAECAAKRNVVQRYQVARESGSPAEVDAWAHALRIAALPYEREPGYRDEWRPNIT